MIKKAKAKRKPNVIVVGVDISTMSIAACAKMYDAVLGLERGPVWLVKRWKATDPFSKRMVDAVKSPDLILNLITSMKGILKDSNDLFIGVEEPWPYGIVRQRASRSLKQQAQIHGAFMAGLFKYGFSQAKEINVKHWQQVVANELDISLTDLNKWDVKDWAQEKYPEIPNWPDLLRKTGELKPRPAESKAEANQPDDRYDSTGIMEYVWKGVSNEQW